MTATTHRRSSALLGNLAVVVCLGIAAAEPHDVRRDLWAGSQLTAEDAAELHARLQHDPHDAGIRTQLIAYHWDPLLEPGTEDARRHRDLVLWLIRNDPGHPVLGTSQATIHPAFRPDAFDEATDLWFAHVGARPDDLAVIANAANFLFAGFRFAAFLEPEGALQKRTVAIHRKARELDPDNPRWSWRLAHLLYAMPLGDVPRAAAEEAIDLLEHAYRTFPEAIAPAYMTPLLWAAYDARRLDRARAYANEALSHPGALPMGGHRYHANLVLGHIALADDDIRDAGERLLAACVRPDRSPFIAWGPNVSLAQKLLRRGERDVVLTYLDNCAQHWTVDERFGDWAARVRAGVALEPEQPSAFLRGSFTSPGLIRRASPDR